MRNLSNILIWKHSFGLLPIHLKPTDNKSNFVMLNGGYGDFCLQTMKDESDLDDYYSKSWSSNTKNFVVLDNDKVKIFNWSKNKPEIIPQKQVLDNFDKFYNYILSKSYKSERDVVPFIIDIFRQFRNITREKTNPVEALNLLFVLLTSLEEDHKKFNTKKWNVNNVNIPNQFDFFTEQIKKGTDNIKPEFDLIIRHSAGVLFQEAQKEVLFFNPQRDLFGNISSKIETKNSLYSSIHYTPPYIARTIVENAIRQLDLNKPQLKIFDPACGSSEFLIESLKQLKENGYNGKIEITGWDSSETAINTSNFLLHYEQRTIWHENLNYKIKLVSDSLVEKWDNNFDLILMNPPFVSWELLKNRDAKNAVREVLDKNFNGKPNQASAFFYKSIQCLKNDGVIGCVIPSSLLTLDTYKMLRNDVNDMVTINLIAKLGNFVFEDALTDVSLMIASKPKSNYTPTMLWTRNEKGVAHNALRDLRKMSYSNEQTINEKDFSIFQPINFPIIQDNWKPISLKENEFLKIANRFIAEQKLFKVRELFIVQQGINSGNNNLFKISSNEYQKLKKSEKIFFRPVIDNNAIKNGQIFLDHYIWYPYDSHGILLKKEVDFKNNAPVFYNKLLPFKPELENRPSIEPANWWHLSRYRTALVKKEPRLFSTRFGNSDSFAFDTNGKFVVENGNAWVPRKAFQTNDYYFYLAVFSSNIFDKLLSIYSRQLSGGKWYDLGGKYTNDIPIPNVHSSEVRNSDAYIKLVEIGMELSTGNTYLKAVSDEILTTYFYPIS